MEEAEKSQQMLAEDTSCKEVPKRWGFRRSTIARREFMDEIGHIDISALSPPRRGARQARGKGRGRCRGKYANEMPSTSPAPKRGRGGRRSAPAKLTSASSPVPPDTHTSLELGGDSLDSRQKISVSPAANPQLSTAPEAASDIDATSVVPVSDQAEDSDELTLQELQERARNRRKLEEEATSPVTDLNLNTNIVKMDVEEVNVLKEHLQSHKNDDMKEQEGASSSCFSRRASGSLTSLNKGQHAARDFGKSEDEEEKAKQNDTDMSSHENSEESDPNAIYCICRQTHNNRFMICCDRCQEWFHGDCVGITETRGRLLEKNGEDYICPTCSPCPSPVDFLKQPVLSRVALSSSSESVLSGEDRPSEDEGIKGKIRKATAHGTKRKFKMFQQVEVVTAVLGNENEEKVKQNITEEKAAAPKCIGPGCTNDALPESVYCGHQCIIRHAAVAMQSISEPKTEPQIQNIQAKPAPKPIPKIQKKTFLEKLFKRKLVEKPVKEEACSLKEVMVSAETEERVAAPPCSQPEPKAPGPQESTAIPPSVFYTSTAVKVEKEDVETKSETKQDALQIQLQNPPTSSEGSEKIEKAENIDDKAASSAPLPKRPASKPLTSRAKKTMPGSPRLAGLKQLQMEPPQVSKSTFTVPEKPSQSQETSANPQASTTSSSLAPEVRVLPVTPAPVPPSRPLESHPNMQMRQNIRRSLSETMLKRVNESDDLEISESNVEKLAVNIEREMFNMYYTTDNKYKNKYRTLLLSLKDPKSKGLFCQVIKGQITPFKLTRMSLQEIQCVQEIVASSLPLKEESVPVAVNMDEHINECEDKTVKTESPATSSEEKMSTPQVKLGQPRKVSTAVSDIISSMLKDTTSEHKAHLFDLKCRICTGQISEDPNAKKIKQEEPKDEEELKTPWIVQMFDKKPPAAAPAEVEPIMESPASPTAEDINMETTSNDFSPLVIPEVSVSITGRDPRTAAYRPAPAPSLSVASAPVPAPLQPQRPTPKPAENEPAEETKTVEPVPVPPPPPPPMPKSILMKPSATSVQRFYTSGSTPRLVSSHTPAKNETSQFLSKQDTVWKGFLNMLNVAKFVTKGYLISGSGSAEILQKELPDTIHIGGRILPQTVWEYVDKVKTSVTKELSLIRFHPATDEEEVAYVSLFSYFNSRRRFGVVSNIGNNIKDVYLIPLCAKESIPSVLLPLEGPGLEEKHPNLLIGLAICQKLKRLGAPLQETDEKRPRIQMPMDSQGVDLAITSAVSDADPDDVPYDPAIAISTTPPASPPASRSPDSSSSSSNSGPYLISNIWSVGNPPTSESASTVKTTSFNLLPDSDLSTSSTTTPLQTILDTLFGKKTQDSDFTVNACAPSPLTIKEPSVPTPTVDPVVQQTPNNPVIGTTELDDDRPYDPEEEYDPDIKHQNATTSTFTEMSKPSDFTATANEVDDDDDDRPYDPEEEYNLGSKGETVSSCNITKSSEPEPSVATSAVRDDIAYDPEDETVFEEMHSYLADNTSTPEYGTTSTTSLSEQQKLLEDLNRQIEEQKRQLEEQEEALRLQRAAVGVSMACFSVSDALMSPPPRFGRDSDDGTEKPLAIPAINPSRDPRRCRNILQDDASDSTITVDHNKEKILTQGTFLSPSSNLALQDILKSEQELTLDVVKKDSDASYVKSPDQMNEINTADKRTSTHLSAPEVEKGAQSSSGNENSHHPQSHLSMSGKMRESHRSKMDNHDSPRRKSRHDSRSHHERRSSYDSRDEADSHRRRSRRSPDRSRRSRSRDRRTETATPRQRDRHRYRSSSRHRSRRDRHSANSSQSRRSSQAESDKSSRRDRSPSGQRTESVRHSTEKSQSIDQVTHVQPEITDNKLKKDEVPEDGKQKVLEIQMESSAKTEIDQLSQRHKPSSDLPGAMLSRHDQFCQQLPLKTSSVERDQFLMADTKQFSQDNKSASVWTDHSSQLPKISLQNKDEPNMQDCFGSDQYCESEAHSIRNHPVKRGFPKNELDRFHHRTHPRSEQSPVLQGKDSLLQNIRDHRGSILHEETFTCQREEPPFGSLQRKDLPRSNFAQDTTSEPRQRNFPIMPPQIQRRDITVDETSRNYPEKPVHGDERDFPPSESDELHYNADSYSGDIPLEETGSGPQRDLPYRPPHLQENEPTDFKNNPLQMPSRNQRGSFSVDEVDRSSDLSQGKPDLPRDFDPREQFRPRAAGHPWRGPQPRGPGPRGPHPESLMNPGGITVLRPRMPGVPAHERFENCGPSPRGRYPRPRMSDVGSSPNFGPRGQSSGPRLFEGSEPQTFGPRGPSPNTCQIHEDILPQDSGFKSRFPGPGISESCRPQMLRPRGPPSGPSIYDSSGPRPEGCGQQMLRPRDPPCGPGIFDSLRPRPESCRPQMLKPRGPSSGPGMMDGSRTRALHSQHVMDGTCDPYQLGHEEPRQVGGPPHQQFDYRDYELPHLHDPRGQAAPPQINKDHLDSKLPNVGGRAPPQEFDNLFDSRDSQPPSCHDSRGHYTTHPPEHSDGSNFQNSVSESFPNIHNPRQHMRTWSRGNPKNLICRSPSHDQPEGPQFPERDSGEHNDFEEPRRRDAQIKGPYLNTPLNFRGQRAPSPHIQRSYAPQNKELYVDKPYSPHFSVRTTPTSTPLVRPLGPKADETQNCEPTTVLKQPQVHVGSMKEPDIRPLRLSGPLLPTPPGGPIRLLNPRMPRPLLEHRSQVPPARVPRAGMKPGRFEDHPNQLLRKNPPNRIQERKREDPGNEEEDSSSQDSSPTKRGRPWRRKPRKREGRNRATRRQSIRTRRQADVEK